MELDSAVASTFDQLSRTFLPYREDYIEEISYRGRPTVSVIIPTLNEAKNLPLVFPYLPKNWIDEVILVDGRSSDNTVEIARQLMPNIKVIMEPRKGKGIAMRTGYEAASGEIVIVLDADGSNDPREIPRFVMALMQGADFVKGSRFAPGGGTTDMPLFRKMGNNGFVILCNLLFGVHFTDVCYGYHAFWKYCMDAFDLEHMDGFEIDTAIYLQAVHSKLRIVEVPSFEGFRFYGMGKLQTIPDGFKVLRTIANEWLRGERVKSNELYLGFRGFKFPYNSIYNTSEGAEGRLGYPENSAYLQMLNAMVLSRGDPKLIMQNVLQLSLQTMCASGGSLILLDGNGEIVEGYRAYGDKIDPELNPDVVKQGLVGWIIKNNQPVLIPNTQEDPRWLKRPWDETNQAGRSAIAYPLVVGDKVVGVITLTRPGEKVFTERDLILLHQVTASAVGKN